MKLAARTPKSLLGIVKRQAFEHERCQRRPVDLSNTRLHLKIALISLQLAPGAWATASSFSEPESSEQPAATQPIS